MKSPFPRLRPAPWATCGAFAALSGVGGCGPHELGSYGTSLPPASAEDAGTDAPESNADADAGLVCTGSAQCNDGDPCNGVHTCDAGVCVESRPACVEADDEACDTCVALDTERCVTLARDRDQDGYAAAACTPAHAPGNDCDDGDARVHPGASERCDHVDNDCDGLLDLEDGRAPGGLTSVLGEGRYPAASWSSSEGVYGLAYEQAGIRFRTLDSAGAPLGESRLVAEADEPSYGRHRPFVAWGHGAFAVTWSREAFAGFRRLDVSGQPLGDVVGVAPEDARLRLVQSQPLDHGAWSLAYEVVTDVANDAAVLKARRITNRDALESQVVTIAPELATLAGFAAPGRGVGLLFTRHDVALTTSSLHWVHLADAGQGEPARAVELVSIGGTGLVGPAVLAASARGYGVAWHEMAIDGLRTLHFAELDASGNLRCGPVNLSPFFPRASALTWPRHMAATQRGYAIVTLTAPNVLRNDSAIELIEVLWDCEYGQRFRVADTWLDSQPTIVSANDGSVLVLWQDEREGAAKLMERRLGPNFCD